MSVVQATLSPGDAAVDDGALKTRVEALDARLGDLKVSSRLSGALLLLWRRVHCAPRTMRVVCVGASRRPRQ
jgi:hypothetical protein